MHICSFRKIPFCKHNFTDLMSWFLLCALAIVLSYCFTSELHTTHLKSPVSFLLSSFLLFYTLTTSNLTSHTAPDRMQEKVFSLMVAFTFHNHKAQLCKRKRRVILMNYYSESCVSFEFQEIAEGKTLYINNSNNLTIPSSIF